MPDWLKARLAEGSTWGAISHWLVIGGLLTFTWNAHWNWFVWAAAGTAVVSAILKDKPHG